MTRQLVSILAAALVAASAGAAAPRPVAPGPLAGTAFRPLGAPPVSHLRPQARSALADASWWGGSVSAGTGERVTVYASASYAQDDAFLRRWADYFAGLVHGFELGRLQAYVAPLADVEEMCGRDNVLGCYGGGMLVMIGEPAFGVTPEEVAAHEYGHHVAASRDNAPWRAVDWGAKRWASAVGVCARAAAGTAFPGDEQEHYRLNPGEAFAETYRALNEARAGSTSLAWDVVDRSFLPDEAAMGAVEQDVVRPWSGATGVSLRGRFVARGPRAWRRTVVTPLDGDLDVRLALPAGAAYSLEVVAAGTGNVLARGLWSGAARQALRFTVCGQRSLVIRVTRRGPAGRFSMRVTRP